MWKRKRFKSKGFLFAFIILMFSLQSVFGQDALTSLKFTVKNIAISADYKEISYDVFVKDIDAASVCVSPAYTVRLTVPQADLGTNAKTVTVNNGTPELGAATATMSVSGTNWLMKFMQQTTALTWASALTISDVGDGTRLGTFHITNTDGTAFANPQPFNLAFSGTTAPLKSSMSLFMLNTTTLAPNSTTAQPVTNFIGLGAYSLTAVATPLTITGVTASNKVYNGTTTATLSGGTLVGVATGDVVTLVAGTGIFADSQVGTGKTVTATGYTLGGADAVKYNLSAQPSGITANITAAPLTVTGVTASNKVYNATTAATLAGGSLTGVLGSDVVTLTAGTGAFANKTVGTAKAVTATGYSIGGADAANYTLSAQPSGLTANITVASLSITGVTVSNKAYDGTTVATLSGGTLVGIATGDVVTLVAGTGAFADKNVGTGKTVTVSGYTLSGANAANYTVSQPTSLSANITAASLTITNPTITLSKVYDGTTTSTVTAGTLSGVLTADVANVTLTTTATYDNSSVGTGKTITVSYSLSGSAAGNYTAPANYSVATGIITDSAGNQLTVSAPTITLKKVYDGTKTVVITAGALTGVAPSDLTNVILNASAEYDDASAGKGKSITVKYNLTGSAANKYTIASEQIFPGGEIERKQLIITNIDVADSKVFNGNKIADVLSLGELAGVLEIDLNSVSVSANANYANANVGTGKTINVLFSINGLAAGNYIAPVSNAITTGVITALPLTVSAPIITLSKVFDGTTKASVTAGVLSGVLPTDAGKVSIVATAVFDTETVGTGKTITVSYSLSGLAAANYIAPESTVVSTGIITGQALIVSTPTISFSKMYDGTNIATVTPGTLSGVTSADASDLVLTANATYDDASAGRGKAITVKYSLSGSAANKYASLPEQTFPGGKIERKQLSITGISVVTNKTVDGNTIAEISTLGNLQGVLTVDESNVSVKSFANYDNATVGTNKTITISYTLLGVAKDNYLVPKDSVISNAVITEKIILNPFESFTVKNEGSDIVLSYTLTSGTPSQYKLTFDSAALAAGLDNIDWTDLLSLRSSGDITLAVPNDMLYGTYQGTLQIRNELGTESSPYTFQFTVNVSSNYIVQIFNDVLTINNSSEVFLAYQWYKNGIEIVGATKQFYCDKNGLNGSYSLKITTNDGVIRYTNPFVINKLTSINVNVYPNPIRINESFSVDAVGFENQELVGAIISVYTTQGTCVYLSTNVEKHNLLKLQLVAPLYIGHIVTKDGVDYEFKVVVNQ